MPFRLPPLPPLRQFEASARHGSFTKAAEELGQTASAVSHAIDSLEKWLGTALFRREARGVTLTTAGQQFLPYVTEGLSLIALGTQRLPGRRTERHLVISVAPTFAQRFLIPRLAKFRKQHPGILLSIDTSPRNMLFPTDGVDMSVRAGKGGWAGVESELLFREQLVPVTSSRYLASVQKGGTIHWPAVTFLRTSSVEQDWSTWIDEAGANISIREELHFDTIQLACEAAAAGLGMAIGRLPLMRPDLESRKLVPAVETTISVETGFWLVSPLGLETRTAMKAFQKWLLDEARSVCAERPMAFGPVRHLAHSA